MYDRNVARANKWKHIQEYKVSRGCSECGYNNHPQALQFDHLRDKTHNISDMIRSDYGLNRIMEEIKKCQVLCANCHAETTYLRKKANEATHTENQK